MGDDLILEDDVRVRINDYFQLAYEEATGDGETRVWQLKHFPLKDLIVTVDNILQETPADYLIDLNTGILTFIVAPADTKIIEIEYKWSLYSAEEIDDLIDQMTDFIQKECGGRVFNLVAYDKEIYDGDDFDRELFLDQYPATEISKVEHNNGTTKDPNWEEDTEGEDYEKYLEEGEIHFHTKYLGKRNYRITYKAGYATIPYDLQNLCIGLVARKLEKRKSEGVRSENLGGASINWGDLLNEDDKLILDNYRRMII